MPIEYIAIWIPFVAIAAIAKIVLTAMRNHQQIKLAQIEGSSGRKSRNAESADRHDERAEMLEDRVRVLERIITDGGYDVATQIEALRDQRQVEELLEDRNGKKEQV